MSLLSTRTKLKLGARSAKAAAERPGTLLTVTRMAAPPAKLVLRFTAPMVGRKARERAEDPYASVRVLAEALAVHGPRVAGELGLIEPPKRKRTAPRVAAGMVLGAGAVYFLEPECGPQHVRRAAGLVRQAT
jgi:hypothetical protein